MSNLKHAIAQSQPPGIYRFETEATRAHLRREAAKADWRLFTLNGSRIKDKASFLEASARAMDFPDYVGKNWDAFEEAINDLTWAPAQGYVVIFDSPERMERTSPEDWKTALDIFESAAENWHKQGIPFYVLLKGDTDSKYPRLG